ncbi:MAG TPA: phospholipase D-like domain-containing protein [Steroidobacteraceae bacterium]|jgi:cardiolipin synthase|nr:phospholipase D-like domain-containing protein [Steroidobacteraceae bacterium]
MRILSLAAALIALCACAQLPTVDEHQLLQEASGTSVIHVHGVRGALSRRQARRVLARVSSQAPDTDTFVRQLAIEQIIAESPLYSGNSVRVLRDGAQTFPAMFAAMEAARQFLYLEYYTLQDVQSGNRKLSDVLAAKARAGVRVRVIYDAVGSLGVPATFLADLRAAGVQLVQYNPINPLEGPVALNERDHRKILIADDQVAIVGGVNLSTTYESAPPLAHALGGNKPQPAKSAHPVWHDVDLEIRGPVVPELEQLFRQHWQEQKGPPLPPKAAYKGPPQGKEIVRVIGSSPARLATRYYVSVLTAIRSAQSSIWMTAAYFVPTPQEMRALRAAARRGVDVRILLPSHSDVGATLAVQRSYYPRLLAAGIKVYERSDGIVHSKSMVVDDVWSLVGSSNFDQRSILFNDEVDVVVLGKTTADQLRKIMLTDIGHGKLIDWQAVRQQGKLQRLKGWFWRLWQRLL